MAFPTAFTWSSLDIILKSVRPLHPLWIHKLLSIVVESDLLMPTAFTAPCWALGSLVSPRHIPPSRHCPHEDQPQECQQSGVSGTVHLRA